MVLPLERKGSRLTLAMVDPEDVLALDDVIGSTGFEVHPVVVTREAMLQALNRYMRLDSQIAEISSELGETAGSMGTTSAPESLEDDDDDAPIVRFVNFIISQAIQDRASDIHIDPAENHLRVRYRIDGVLKDTQRAPASIKDGVISRLKIMSGI